MIELELFYKIVEAEIRRRHIKYLRKQKCLPESKTVEAVECQVEQSDVDEFPSGENAKYIKRFNKGIDTALNVLAKEFERFNKRLKDESEKGRRL